MVYLILGSAQWLTIVIYFAGGHLHPMEDPFHWMENPFHPMEDSYNPLFLYGMAVPFDEIQLNQSTNHTAPSLKSLTSGKFELDSF